MIRRIQALNYRCLRYVDVPLDRFHVLIGPNSSGKSTLLDAVLFFGELIQSGLHAALEKRTRNFQDLVWGRPGTGLGFELAVEFDLTDYVRNQLPPGRDFRVGRYEIAIKEGEQGVYIDSERCLLVQKPKNDSVQGVPGFSRFSDFPETILSRGDQHGSRMILNRNRKGECFLSTGTSSEDEDRIETVRIRRPSISALEYARLDPEDFPVAYEVFGTLGSLVKRVVLDARSLREASPRIHRHHFVSFDEMLETPLNEIGPPSLESNGSSLPWNVLYLKEHREREFSDWVHHVRTVLPDLEDIRVVEREDDRHAYLMLRYENGVQVPSWTSSEGTLKLLVLTVLAYSSHNNAIFLIEEPDNGLHPLALDAVYDSLSSIYEGQVLVTTHSPAFLRLARPEEALCFARASDGSTVILRGNDHPHLRDWRESADMDLLFATGVIE